jgi:hypothetical protein
MKRTIDDLPLVKTSTLRAHGYVGAETKTTLIRFDDSGVEYQVGVTAKPLPCGAAWSMFICPRCHGRAQRLRLLDGRPACGACVRASGLIYRSQSVRTEKRHLVTAPPRIALLRRDTPMRVNSRPNRVAERRVNAEIALRRSLIVARKHGVDRAKDQGL